MSHRTAGDGNQRHPAPFGQATDIGRSRTHNEDSLLAKPPLYVVADGMGGHAAGEVASRVGVDTLVAHAPLHADSKALARAIRAANNAIIDAVQAGTGKQGMGTTMVAAIVEGTRIALAHVGDSRAYLLHDGALRQLTADHSLVARMVSEGQITEAQAREHPHRSVILRALGTDPDIKVDHTTLDAQTGDRLLLCSDGLSGMLEDPEIARILGGYKDPQVVADMLVAEANEAGGLDNITVVVVDMGVTAYDEGRASSGRWRMILAVTVFLAVAIAILALAYWRLR